LFTLKIPAKIPAPIANVSISITKAIVIPCEAVLYSPIIFLVEIHRVVYAKIKYKYSTVYKIAKDFM